jgi:hypothetical protein
VEGSVTDTIIDSAPERVLVKFPCLDNPIWLDFPYRAA